MHKKIQYLYINTTQIYNNKMKWEKNDKYYEGTTLNFILKNKIASFDLDGTLITPKSGKKFPMDKSDWIWKYKDVPKKLIDYYNNDYSIIIISNQGGIAEGKQSGDEWIEKMTNITNELKIEMKILCSIDKNRYRKPLPTFKDEFFPNELNKDSFYCGDAVGRKGDISDTDYKFALNSKINFYTPEYFFLGKENELPKIEYCFDISRIEKNEKFRFEPREKEIIIMMGYPGSGKSTISKKLEEKYGYKIINQDLLKTKLKCQKEAEKFIKNNESVIIDSTNPTKEKRKEGIDLGKKNGYNIRVIEMTTSIGKSKHNNIYRSLVNEEIDIVPDIVYNMYKSKYENVDLNEGIDEIIKQNQNNPKDEKYYLYLF
jgi:bifunctional polynucleotide phosphatase/kinase